MAQEHVDINTLIQGIQLTDPRLYQILQELNRGLGIVQDELFPLVLKDRLPPEIVPILPPPIEFTFAFTPITVRLFWSQVDNAFGYEVREGAVWETANFLFRN